MTNPVLINTPFAANGDKNTILDNERLAPNNPTWSEGWDAVTSTPINSGGEPPKREDFNGVLYAITDNIVHQSKGLGYEFDAVFATKIGGYPLGAKLRLTDGTEVISTINNNTNNPNSNMTGWMIPTGGINSVDSIDDLLAISNPRGGQIVETVSYYLGVGKGTAQYLYDSSKSSINNGITILNGWVLQNNSNTINCFVAGFKADGTDETLTARKCIDLGLSVEIPINVEVGIDSKSGLWTQWAYGLGRIKWLNYTPSTDMERVVNANIPTQPVDTETYQQQQNANVRGALGGKNVGKRFECNPVKADNYTFDSMRTLVDYGGADIVADMVAITDREVKQYSGATYTSTTVQHNGFKTDDIQVGDFIRAGSNILGVVSNVNKDTGVITLIDGWGNTDTKQLNVTPPSGAICYTPIAYRMWGRNDYVTARANNSEIHNIIGYELDIVAGHDLQDACGFYPVAFGTDTCVAAFRTGKGNRNWWYGLHCPDGTVNVAVQVGKNIQYGIQHGAQNTSNSITVYSSQAQYGVKVESAQEASLRSDNTVIAVDVNNADTGLRFNSGSVNSSVIRNYADNYLVKSVVVGKGEFTMTALGKTNRNIKAYTNVAQNITLSRDNTNSIVIVSSPSVTSIQLSTSFEDGEILEFYSNQSQNVDIGGITTLGPSKKYAKIIHIGSSWIVLS